eukprot:1901810-Prymnesium_polylepis.1
MWSGGCSARRRRGRPWVCHPRQSEHECHERQQPSRARGRDRDQRPGACADKLTVHTKLVARAAVARTEP